jgi:hypothetical protein
VNVTSSLADAASGGGSFSNAYRPALVVRGSTTFCEVDAPEDALSLSPAAAMIADSGLEPLNCWTEQVGSRLDFRLEFSSQAVQQLTASGSYESESGELNLSCSFLFQREVTVNGQVELRSFEAQLSLRAGYTRSRSSQTFKVKEDIGSLLRRLVDNMLDVARSGNQRLAGVVFDQEDLSELAALDHGRMLNLLSGLIQMVITYCYSLKRLKEGEDSEAVILTPHRRCTEGVKVEEQVSSVQEFSLEIKEIDVQSSAGESALAAA